jgi:cell division protein FtsQ
VRRRELLSTWPGRAIAVGAGLALGGGALVVGTYTPIFDAREVRVEGNRRVSDDEIQRLAGLSPGTNVFHADLGEAAHDLEADPRVAEAEVTRDLPATLVIRVDERTPIGAVLAGTAPTVVAGDGTPLPGMDPKGLPEIRPLAGDLSEANRTAAASVLAAMRPALRGRVRTVDIAPSGDVVVGLRGGVVVSYGMPVALEAKGQALQAVLGWAVGGGLELAAVDVRIPNAPTARTPDGLVTIP